MQSIRPARAGVVLALLLAVFHLLWSLLVAVGWAQPSIDFIFRLHFIKPVYEIGTFNAGTAALLIVVSATFGFAMGWTFAVLWNRFAARGSEKSSSS